MEVNSLPPSDPASTSSATSSDDLAKQMAEREIAKLDLEIVSLRSDIEKSEQPYLTRNPQVIPTAIAALGAVIGLGVGLYSNYFTTVHEKADHSSDALFALAAY